VVFVQDTLCDRCFQGGRRGPGGGPQGITGGARKLVILDLDDTLWGGVVGDIGWSNLRLGGHDPVGEAYRDFQLALKALTRRGILLAVASKNEERTALEAITSQPEMVLSLDDFAGWRINWNDKVQNIIALASDLNLGLEAAVFIDDNPAERARVREALPSLLVPEWPKSPLNYVAALGALDCFDAPFVSAEDRQRTAMYVSERKRKQLQDDVPSLETWLSILELMFIGDDVYLENEYPGCVEIEDHVEIGLCSVIIAHLRGPGQVVIKKAAWIGACCVISSAKGRILTIGEGAVVGAGSVITSDVPAFAFVKPAAPQQMATVAVPLATAPSYMAFLRGLRPMRPAASVRDGASPKTVA
jgi:HAD superfamily phosphatase (TIGR01681 family)